MGLTLKAQQRLQAAELIDFFDHNAADWQELAQHAFDYVRINFPDGEIIRRDDVAKAILPVLEVHKGFLEFRNEANLTQKYWISDFADWIIDRVWDNLNKGAKNENEQP